MDRTYETEARTSLVHERGRAEPPSARSQPLLLVVTEKGAPAFAAELLRGSGFGVETARDQPEAVALFERWLPDLVLIGPDSAETLGCSVCQAIRSLPAGAEVPVLIAAKAEAATAIRRAFEAGATDVILSPLEPLVLVHRLQHLLAATQALEEARRSQERLEQAERLTHFGTWEWDLVTKRFHCSREVYRILGTPRKQGYQTWESFLTIVHPQDQARVEGEISSALAEQRHFAFDHRVVHDNGMVRVLHHEGDVASSCEGDAVCVRGILQDVTELKKAKEKIRNLVNFDGLTELPNREMFRRSVSNALARSLRSNRLVAILLLDIDRFKRVNETRGQNFGDRLLKEVSARLAGCLRRGDYVVRHQDTNALARRGGDEFVIMLSDIKQIQDVVSVARRILAGLEAPFRLSGEEVFITGSMGISIAPGDGSEVENLVQRAETAMYCAKSRGGNSFQFFAEEMNATVLRKLELERKLRKALERDELEVFYQPLVDAHNRRFVGVEALLRWRQAEMGLVLPGDFIPVAEETGLIVPIGEWVLRTACQQVVDWRKQGLPPLRISVNLAHRQLREQTLVASVARILQEIGLEPGQLELEVTESSVMKNEGEVLRSLQELARMGVRLAVDDFGTGYSAISYLRKFPLNTLKIDRSFVHGIGSDSKDSALTTALIVLAHRLQLRVVAEGVETEQQMAFLQKHDCDLVQGYLFARPEPAQDLLQVLTKGCALPA